MGDDRPSWAPFGPAPSHPYPFLVRHALNSGNEGRSVGGIAASQQSLIVDQSCLTHQARLARLAPAGQLDYEPTGGALPVLTTPQPQLSNSYHHLAEATFYKLWSDDMRTHCGTICARHKIPSRCAPCRVTMHSRAGPAARALPITLRRWCPPHINLRK
jgi:hypothetical protein